MPQMGPMLWLVLYTIFLLLLFSIVVYLSFLYCICPPLQKDVKEMLNKFKLKFKFKW